MEIYRVLVENNHFLFLLMEKESLPNSGEFEVDCFGIVFQTFSLCYSGKPDYLTSI